MPRPNDQSPSTGTAIRQAILLLVALGLFAFFLTRDAWFLAAIAAALVAYNAWSLVAALGMLQPPSDGSRISRLGKWKLVVLVLAGGLAIALWRLSQGSTFNMVLWLVTAPVLVLIAARFRDAQPPEDAGSDE